MSRSSSFRFVVGAIALFIIFAMLSADSRGDGKKTGQTQIVHGCITKVVLAVGTTPGTVEFTHPKWGGKVKVIETGTTKTVIEVCGEVKTLAQLKTLVEAVKTGDPKYCGIARIDNRTSMTASKILVCNDGSDD
jgi:hypothetical protein